MSLDWQMVALILGSPLWVPVALLLALMVLGASLGALFFVGYVGYLFWMFCWGFVSQTVHHLRSRSGGGEPAEEGEE